MYAFLSFSENPIANRTTQVQDLTFSQYLALLTVADAFLVTSLREGMALRTHEFVECQEGKENPGGLILSEVRDSTVGSMSWLNASSVCRFL